ncbi:MAG TPA: Gfo/Idh/MocA family oxidoreductase, partial [Bacillales bacterium]|nr:Gfo/Idh/MocA family oxidoreductase [Bacillales bacterium]
KPLALTLNEAKRMQETVEKAGVVHMVSHNYRFAPAVQLTKKLIEEGRIGKIYHIRAHYLQDFLMDPQSPMTWRLRKEVSGSGALGDIGTHIIDLARFLVGEFKEVVGTTETFIKERPFEDKAGKPSGRDYGKVTVDGATAFLAHFENDVLGVFEATRFAGGNRNKNKFEINGEKGSIRWDLEHMNMLEVFLEDDDPELQGFRTINCTEEQHPYGGTYWPPGHIIGYEHTFIHLIHELINGISKGTKPEPNFSDGVKNQAVLEAVEQSAKTGRWINIPRLLDSNNHESE